MFGLSGVDGEFFRGTLEELLRTEGVRAARRARGVEHGAHEPVSSDAALPPDDHRYRQAVAAYAASQRPPIDRGPVFHAYQVMSRRVLTLAPETPVDGAWRVLAAGGVGQAPVVTAGGHIVGLVSRAHLLHVLNEDHGHLTEIRAVAVADVMQTPVVTVAPIADVRRVAAALLTYDLPALPVVDHDSGTLVGIVSRSDVLRCVTADPPLTLWA